jgi:hypothetical protein
MSKPGREFVARAEGTEAHYTLMAAANGRSAFCRATLDPQFSTNGYGLRVGWPVRAATPACEVDIVAASVPLAARLGEPATIVSGITFAGRAGRAVCHEPTTVSSMFFCSLPRRAAGGSDSVRCI